MFKHARLQSGTSEQVVKILDITDFCSYLFIGQKGTVIFRNSDLQDEFKFKWDLCSEKKKLHTTCMKTRIASFSVTDASYLEVSKHYCLSTTHGTLHFIHGSPSAHWETFRLIEFPTVPTCLENNFQKTNKSSTCQLFIGDHKGNVYILTFLFPLTMLFARDYSLGTQIIRFEDLKKHRSYIKYRKVSRVHWDVIDKIQHIPQHDFLISNSKLDTLNPLVLQDISTVPSSKTYRHIKGVTCFDLNNLLNIIVTGSRDFIIRTWDVSFCRYPVMLLEGHKAVVSDLRICSKGDTLLSICKAVRN
ncbi:WD repeat-containing protein on Y chromosome-like [Stegodyphus dumicola]|uniref:WD repeat-containing protein on Y chromosome-like n=1 Tax=Stegodyphus dumicola TaxID=202533 RepID=UPI0015A9AEE5|nr:WD repeat-containing protein on Y chromosome-like [Stegodyphus dumicola]